MGGTQVTMTGLVKQNYTYLRHGYVNYRSELLNYALIKTQNLTLAEDLVQSTFLRAWTHLVKGGQINVMKGFLFHLLKTLIIDEYENNRPTSLEVLVQKGFEPYVDENETLANTYDKKLAIDLIDELPRLYQQVLRLRYVQNLSFNEIAKVTGRSRNAVTVQSHRGLKKLKSLYTKKTKEPVYNY